MTHNTLGYYVMVFLIQTESYVFLHKNYIIPRICIYFIKIFTNDFSSRGRKTFLAR